MSTNYTKLKTNLRLCIQRLQMAEKKKTELAQKSRREIGDYLRSGKLERARIRVEHIIREDFLVEAMELVEMYCDLVITRFGLVQQLKTLDEGLAEAISSLIWVAPRLQTDCPELKIVCELLTQKYGKIYAQAARENSLNSVSEKLMHKMSIQAPPPILVEKYMIEIAKALDVPYEANDQLLQSESKQIGYGVDVAQTIPGQTLIDFNCEPIGLPSIPPALPSQPPGFSPDPTIVRPIGFSLPDVPSGGSSSVAGTLPADLSHNLSSSQMHSKAAELQKHLLSPADEDVDKNKNLGRSPPPNYDSLVSSSSTSSSLHASNNLPNVPNAPGQEDSDSDGDINFDDLAARFERLKNAK